MSHLCPVMPTRPLRPWQWLTLARDNGLSVWHQGALAELLMHRRLPGRDLWVLNNPSDVRQVLVRDAGHYIKSPETWRPLQPLLGRSLLLCEDEDWRLRRRLIAPLLTGPERLHDYESLMIALVEEMLGRWETLEEGAELEMTWECMRLAAEVVSQALFGFRLDGHARTVYEGLTTYQDTLGRLDLMSLLGLPAWLPRPGEREARGAVARLETVVEAIMEAVRWRGGSHRDLPGLLMDAPSSGPEALAPKAIRDEFMLALLAGHETTANAMGWTFYLLSQDARVRAVLEAEVDRELAGATPRPGDLARLPYLGAVISESLRLYPPIYQLTRQARGECRLGRQTLADGSLLVISPWLLHRHHRFWKEPHAFRPERFLEAGGRRRSQCYIPFGAGPRVCPGAGFAIQELACVLAMSAQRFRLDLVPGARVEPVGRLTLRPSPGLPMRLSCR